MCPIFDWRVADRPGKYDKVKSVGELRDCETMGTDIGREEFLVELHITLQAPVELAGLPAIPYTRDAWLVWYLLRLRGIGLVSCLPK